MNDPIGEASLRFEIAESGHRYEAFLADERVAYAEVDPISTDGLLIKHTEVVPAFEGRGFGSALVRHMLVDARKAGRSVIPICPYAASYIKRHPEYLEYVRESYRAALASAHS